LKNEVKYKNQYCEYQKITVFIMLELFSFVYMVVQFSVCHRLWSLHFRVNSLSAWTEKFSLLRVILRLYGSLRKVLLQQEHLIFPSQPIVPRALFKDKDAEQQVTLRTKYYPDTT